MPEERPPEIAKKIAELKPSFSALSTDKLVEMAETMGKFLAQGDSGARLNTGQIRKFLDAVSRIKNEGGPKAVDDSFFRSQCMLLKPKLAYAAGRQGAVRPLMEVLLPCINGVHDKEDFTHFYRFI
jgi:CRISPR-associated protein Csm2